MLYSLRKSGLRMAATTPLLSVVSVLCGLMAILQADRLWAQGLGVASAVEAAKPEYVSGDLNLEFSRIYIKVGKVGLGHEHGVIAKLKEGKLRLDEDGSGKLVFNMASMDADSKEARAYVGLEGETDESTKKQVNTNMRGSEVLDVQRFPTSTFEVTKVKLSGKNSQRGLPEYIIEGQFILKGKSRPVTIRSDVETKNGWLHVRGILAIVQSDFGMKPYSKMLGAVGASDRLEIFGDLWIAP